MQSKATILKFAIKTSRQMLIVFMLSQVLQLNEI